MPEDVRDLVTRARRGDQAAFWHLKEAKERPLARQVAALGWFSVEDLADVLSETWLSIWKGLPRLRDPQGFDGWAWRIAYRRACDALPATIDREASRTGVAGSDDEGADDADHLADQQTGPASDEPERRVLAHELRAQLEEAYLRLPLRWRPVFYLRVMAEPPHTNDETATRLGMPCATVRTHFHRACKLMRQWLAPYIEG